MRRRNWAVLLLAPALLSGCGVLDALTGSGGDSATGSAAAAGGPTQPPWVVVSQGSTAPSPKPSFPALPPSPSAHAGYLPITPATASPVPRPTCTPNFFRFQTIQGAQVVPGTTSAVITWFNIGGSNVIEFRLTAINQNLVGGKQRDVGWTIVKPNLCGEISATMTGLRPKTDYVFSVDAVVRRQGIDGGQAATVARSGAVRTL